MAQLSIFGILHPHEYIIDSSSIFSQKPNEPHRRNVYPSLWRDIDTAIKEHKIVICSEIRSEIQDKDLIKWFKELNGVVLEVDDEIQENVIRIVKDYPKLVSFEKGKSSGDAFLIATAMKYGLAVITEEKKEDPKRIPYVCNAFSINCMNIVELCIAEGWHY